jgi:hypothetical protein
VNLDSQLDQVTATIVEGVPDAVHQRLFKHQFDAVPELGARTVSFEVGQHRLTGLVEGTALVVKRQHQALVICRPGDGVASSHALPEWIGWVTVYASSAAQACHGLHFGRNDRNDLVQRDVVEHAQHRLGSPVQHYLRALEVQRDCPG